MAFANGSNGTVKDEAFITLATNDVYSRGALVLAESLKKHRTTRQLVIMITPHVSPTARVALEHVFDVVKYVDVLDSHDVAHLAMMKRPELGITFTKIHCWTLTEYKKCVFMDADMLALQNIDDLFEREELSASPDSGWPDIFNSGLFVFRPCIETFNALLTFATEEGSFDGGDQGLLNMFFRSWTTDMSKHLPFLYNLHVSASYTYLPAFRRFGKDTKVAHFLGPVKPWHHVYNRVTGGVQQIAGPIQQGEVRHYPEFLKEWWAIYNEKIQKFFSREEELVTGGGGGALISICAAPGGGTSTHAPEASAMAEESTLGDLMIIPSAIIPGGAEAGGASAPIRGAEEIRQEMLQHMMEWERGNPDYMGKDSFSNIQAALDLFLK